MRKKIAIVGDMGERGEVANLAEVVKSIPASALQATVNRINTRKPRKVVSHTNWPKEQTCEECGARAKRKSKTNITATYECRKGHTLMLSRNKRRGHGN